ncbi:potassium uptake system protein [Peptococcaceae bacterium SCADC1_2_3]|jgi:trk system potassium uptake protein TrkA|nr:potassium uptake system protein [Peptococcaceae bacterium SCADC1_2_3]KFI35665.1 potassium uptake system protein [Peptococcaceae bacterium SCADC1_2_3]KFI37624.1 potassium uptake system protein [Peptococcaceae bacterium SCADC1_2_3]HBQ28406.1 TrkA family potassium uptake protein [Desulfotomaculum sp.]HCJ79333.1 TrkA family potassium uptake protein [Desulfotomaculum sp.]
MKQFAVIGLGRFGSSLARALSRMGYEVLAIDTNEENVNDITDEITYAVQMDALEENALKSTGIRNFDTVIVAIGQDIQASILVTVMLKEMGVKKVIAKAQTELHGKVLEKVGADLVVFPERDMGERLAHTLIAADNIMDLINLSPDYSIIELKTPPGFIGKTLQETALRKEYGITVIAIRRGLEVIISPEAKQVIRENDILVTIGRNEKLKRLER